MVSTWEDKHYFPREVRLEAFGLGTSDPVVALRINLRSGETASVVTDSPDEFFAEVEAVKEAWANRWKREAQG